MPASDPYRRLFEGSPQPMWVVDAGSLRFLAVNDAAVARYGFTRREFLALTLADIRLSDTAGSSSPAAEGRATERHRVKAGDVIQVAEYWKAISFRGRNALIVLAMDATGAADQPGARGVGRQHFSSDDPYETLSARERQVLALAAQGLANRDVAARLKISRRTAETHRSNLMRKLGLKGERALVRFAVRRGILDLSD